MAAGSHMTTEIWSLTLEIIRLLNGEIYADTQPGGHVTITVTPPPSLTPDRLTLRKILEVTRTITELLIGEMELCLEVKAENEAEPVMEEAEPDMEEAGYSEVGGDLWPEVKMEPSEVTAVGSPLEEYGDGSAAGETGVSSEEPCKEEDILHVIVADESYSRDKIEKHAAILFHGEKEEDDITAKLSGAPTTPNLLSVLPPEDLSSDPSKQSECHTVFAPRHKALTNNKPYCCSECGKCFSSKSYILIHERVHTGEKPFTCSVCGKGFPSNSGLLKHNTVHTGEKPYSCSECGKCFSRKPALTIHERLHTGEKPFTCSECGKCYTHKSNLMTHMRFHTGEKPYSCSDCGRCFSYRSDFNGHMRVHSGKIPYSCSECGKGFYQKTSLNSHERTHTGEKPYACSQCERCFALKSHLKKHEKQHSVNKSGASL